MIVNDVHVAHRKDVVRQIKTRIEKRISSYSLSRQDDKPTRVRTATDDHDGGLDSDGADVGAATKTADCETREDEENQLVTAFDDLPDRCPIDG